MKKQLLVGAFLLASFFTANAQILSEDFSAAPAGWTIADADGDTNNWGITTGNANTDAWGLSGNFSSSISWTQAAPLTPDNFLFTSEIAIPANGATLTFLKGYTYYNAADGAADQLSVYAVTADMTTIDLIIAEEPLFDEVFNTPTDENFVPSATTATVNLSAFAGQTIKIAFRHRGENQERVFIDTVVVTEGATAGVNENSLANLSVYPNPTSDVVNVSVDALVSNVAIADLNGRTVKTVKFDGVSNASVNVSDLASGVYMMTVSSDKGATTKKIVKN
jgi:hypothetical protein